MGNFVECIKTRKPPIAEAEIGHRSASICHLGVIALRLGRKLNWDPQKEQFVNDKEADGFLSRDATLVTGGTDNHIVLLDVTSFGLTGRQAETALLDAGVVTNRNSVPADPNGAWYTSGIRLGTPALTTRGFGHDEFDRVAELVVDVLHNTSPGTTKAGAPSKATYELVDGVASRTHAASAEMLDKHPLYPGLELT